MQTEHVDTMSANYGGTVMRGALENVFASRKADIPTAVFVLTDGQVRSTAFSGHIPVLTSIVSQVQDVNQTVAPVEQAVQQAARDAPVRVFTLGIGRTTSTAMCEGISRAGNGICLMATMAETIISKCSRLVRASRTYVLKNVSVGWGVRTDLAEAYRTGNTELAGVRQAPADISSLYPGNRFIVFALIENEAFTPPKEVVIHAQRDGYGEVLQFSVPVQVVDFPPRAPPSATPPDPRCPQRDYGPRRQQSDGRLTRSQVSYYPAWYTVSAGLQIHLLRGSRQAYTIGSRRGGG